MGEKLICLECKVGQKITYNSGLIRLVPLTAATFFVTGGMYLQLVVPTVQMISQGLQIIV